MRQLPGGTVTFLFTDIEGSTLLLRELGDEYAGVLAEHRRALREAFSHFGGVEVDTQGDALFVAFSRASDAASAAAAGQRALAGGAVRVRMGLHTGEPIVTEEGYVGIDVHHGARIMSAGHGGQVLLSQATRDLVASSFELRDLGEHRLKDLTAPQRLYQLERAGRLWGTIENDVVGAPNGGWIRHRAACEERVFAAPSPELERGCAVGRGWTLADAVEEALS